VTRRWARSVSGDTLTLTELYRVGNPLPPCSSAPTHVHPPSCPYVQGRLLFFRGGPLSTVTGEKPQFWNFKAPEKYLGRHDHPWARVQRHTSAGRGRAASKMEREELIGLIEAKFQLGKAWHGDLHACLVLVLVLTSAADQSGTRSAGEGQTNRAGTISHRHSHDADDKDTPNRQWVEECPARGLSSRGKWPQSWTGLWYCWHG
jgi:hypothetical protein